MAEHRIERLVAELRENGSARSGSEDGLEEWRRDARAAARRLGRPVETISSRDGLAHAALRDWPRDERERVVHLAALRRVVRATGQEP